MSLSSVMDRLQARAASDPALLETLEYLATSEASDPFATPPPDARRLARDINRQRQADRAGELAERSLTTSEVVELVASISDRKGVDRRRQRGRLLGISGLGRQTLHPRWQFDTRRGDTHPGLAEVLDALDVVAGDAIDADAIATAPRDEVGGASIADLLAAGDVETAVALARLAGDQS
jgi:hypothetical protein